MGFWNQKKQETDKKTVETKADSTTSNTSQKTTAQSTSTVKEEEKTKSSVKSSELVKGPTLSTQTYLRFSEIRENTLVMKNGGLRSVLKVSSINFSLKSEDEQNAIIYSYQGFLNTLDSPIQIIIKSKKLDIDHYIENLRKTAVKQKNTLLKKQTVEYADYIQKLVEYADIMEKQFFVVVSEDPVAGISENFLTKFFRYIRSKESFTDIKIRRQQFDELKKKLTQKTSGIKIGLENCGLQVKELNTKELIGLFYESYNPSVSRYQKSDILGETQITDDEKLKVEDSGI